MAWVRVDDHFPDHPKIVSAGPLASWLYVAGLCYCNRLLTNGFIPFSQVARLAPHRDDQDLRDSPIHLAHRLCELTLWAESERKGVPGFMIHDYLKYQPSKKDVIADRAKTAARQGRFRESHSHTKNNAVTNAVSNTGGNTAPNPNPNPNPNPKEQRHVQPPTDFLEKESERKPDARSKRPVYTSDRFAVFEWQLDELGRMLGPHVLDFDLHGFFDDLSQQTRLGGLVIPKASVWEWLQAQVLAEVKLRHLPIATAEPPRMRVGQRPPVNPHDPL